MKTNHCLKCKWWQKDYCNYDPCEECRDNGLIPYFEFNEESKDKKYCDGTCNPPECCRGYDAMPEEWNPKYKYNPKYDDKQKGEV